MFSGLLVTRPYDYCNSLLAGVAGVYLQRLQSVQNAAARGLRGSSSRPVLDSLHWLPVRQRIIYKTAVLVWKCLHDAAPRYLADLCAGPFRAWSPATTFHGVWDSTGPAHPDGYYYVVNWLLLRYVSTYQRSFAVNGPRTWNSLPAELRTPDMTLCCFNRHLKAHHFQQ